MKDWRLRDDSWNRKGKLTLKHLHGQRENNGGNTNVEELRKVKIRNRQTDEQTNRENKSEKTREENKMSHTKEREGKWIDGNVKERSANIERKKERKKEHRKKERKKERKNIERKMTKRNKEREMWNRKGCSKEDWWVK